MVLAAGIVLSVAAWFYASANVERDARAKFHSSAAAFAASAQTRMHRYSDLLYGVQGLFQAAPALSREAFDNYAYSLNLPLHYPGARSISYARRVSAAGMAKFEQRLRRDPVLLRRGVGAVVVRPPGKRAEYLVVEYVEPLRANKTALGYDLASDPSRMTVVERARDTGMPALSGRLLLAADPTQSETAALMRLALYLKHALIQAQRNGTLLAVLFIDLDRFKNINDTLGHGAGDDVLKQVAERLRAALRAGDTVGRLGGDEFVVLIEDMQSLLKNADIAMYRAKELGKNNYQFYSAQMNVHSVERLALESGLRHALGREEFVLHYQPKVDIGNGRITGMEALVRWQHPSNGLIAPLQFIPLAEETGLIVPIGEWVLRTACAQNKAWRNQGLPPLRVAVNLSARQFAHESLLQDVERVLQETGLDPVALEIEITESMVMQDPERAVTLLHRLKAMGIYISIDDFGTGYSSLSYLKRFPIDSMKIDRSFIKDLPLDQDDATITQAIIAMTHGLKLGAVAEGVETGEQLAFLRGHGCDEMKGFHFSKPVPAPEFAQLVLDYTACGSPRPALSKQA